ncbi:hypothetical protein R5R35_009493 [Gryllus longicercus]|uniref:Uncharacterized protein n=1 Tax=Gryllus longicercus TaxID=2509291 RepID=A0AAN9VCP9_9ORTH
MAGYRFRGDETRVSVNDDCMSLESGSKMAVNSLCYSPVSLANKHFRRALKVPIMIELFVPLPCSDSNVYNKCLTYQLGELISNTPDSLYGKSIYNMVKSKMLNAI